MNVELKTQPKMKVSRQEGIVKNGQDTSSDGMRKRCTVIIYAYHLLCQILRCRTLTGPDSARYVVLKCFPVLPRSRMHSSCSCKVRFCVREVVG